jgi:two-component system chemotaxis sensor kinase CheA
MADPFRYFRIEARDLVEQFQRGLLDLEKGAPAVDVVPKLLRLAHTLKGAARVVRQREIADLSHAIEDALVPARDSSAPLTPDAISSLLEHVDSIRVLLGELGDTAPRASSPPAAPNRLARAANTGAAESEPRQDAGLSPGGAELLLHVGRASNDEVDAVVDGVAELTQHVRSLRSVASALGRARALADLLSDQLAPRRGGAGTPAATAKLRAVAAELGTTIGRVERDTATSIEQAGRELMGVRDAAERLRLTSVEPLLDALERTARDAAVRLGKRLRFDGSGRDVRLESDVLIRVQRALLQAVRNAVAHGIETPAERAAAGKSEEGTLAIEVVRRGRHVVFICRDDGRGIDQAAVQRVAAKRAGGGKPVQELDSDELTRLLLRGGISTAADVDEISGRGIGLDVVRETAERLGGSVDLRSTPGQGVELELSVPASLSALRALIVEAAGESVALPLSAVLRGARSRAEQVSRGSDGEAVLVDGSVVPFVPLARLLRLEKAAGESVAWSTVLLETPAGALALGVDRLLGTENLVARALPQLMLADPIVAGASLDADGNPRMLLSPEGIGKAARQFATLPRVELRARVPILVIDDSLTTRMLEQSILESAGYEVELATSGEEGLDMARRRKFALILVDVEMPGMDGFTFLEEIRKDPALRDVPALLVTSRAAPEDLERGRRVGASGHIAKNEFEQNDLLRRIEQLVS